MHFPVVLWFSHLLISNLPNGVVPLKLSKHGEKHTLPKSRLSAKVSHFVYSTYQRVTHFLTKIV